MTRLEELAAEIKTLSGPSRVIDAKVKLFIENVHIMGQLEITPAGHITITRPDGHHWKSKVRDYYTEFPHAAALARPDGFQWSISPPGVPPLARMWNPLTIRGFVVEAKMPTRALAVLDAAFEARLAIMLNSVGVLVKEEKT